MVYVAYKSSKEHFLTSPRACDFLDRTENACRQIKKPDSLTLATIMSTGDSWRMAATDGDVATMERCVKALRDKNVDISDPIYGLATVHETALHVAAEHGQKEIIEFLIKCGADVNTLTGWGCTPLHIAVWQRKTLIAKTLVDNGANVTILDDDGESILYFAALRGDLDCVTFLIENGADVNCGNKAGRTPLHTAAKHDHDHVVKFLIERGAKVDANDIWGSTPLDCAVASGRKTPISLLKNTMQEREHARMISIALCLAPLELPILALYTIYTSKLRYPECPVSRYNAWVALKRMKSAP